MAVFPQKICSARVGLGRNERRFSRRSFSLADRVQGSYCAKIVSLECLLIRQKEAKHIFPTVSQICLMEVDYLPKK